MKSSKKPAPAVRPSAKMAKPAKAKAAATARKSPPASAAMAKPRAQSKQPVAKPVPPRKPAARAKTGAPKPAATTKPPVAVAPVAPASVRRSPARATKLSRSAGSTKPAAKSPRAARRPTALPRSESTAVARTSPPVAKAIAPPPAEVIRESVALPRRPRPARIPPLLLEGDESVPPVASGPGARSALGAPVPAVVAPVAGSEPVASPPAGLPESYGTRQLWLAARDPHWLFASWDFSPAELDALETRAAAGHLTLRVYEEGTIGAPLTEVMLAKGATSWFVHVGRAGAGFQAELGFALAGGGWESLARSAVARTPAEAAAPASAPTFTTIPVDVPFRVVLAAAAEAVRASEPVQAALEGLREQGFDALPAPEEVRRETWTPEQERALAEVLRVDAARRVRLSSIDLTEAVSRELAEAGAGGEAPSAESGPLPSGPVAEAGGMAAPVTPAASSPVGGFAGAPAATRDFWFNVNAELVIYGATEPDAILRVAGRRLALRPDGSFSLRFALPDGEFELPVVAASADGVETRHAELRFVRRTEYRGEVGRHPQDGRLRPPTAEAVGADEER